LQVGLNWPTPRRQQLIIVVNASNASACLKTLALFRGQVSHASSTPVFIFIPREIVDWQPQFSGLRLFLCDDISAWSAITIDSLDLLMVTAFVLSPPIFLSTLFLRSGTPSNNTFLCVAEKKYKYIVMQLFAIILLTANLARGLSPLSLRPSPT